MDARVPSGLLGQRGGDYGNPSVTAKDVLDRDGLKAFVTQTGNHYIARLQAAGLEAAPS